MKAINLKKELLFSSFGNYGHLLNFQSINIKINFFVKKKVDFYKHNS